MPCKPEMLGLLFAQSQMDPSTKGRELPYSAAQRGTSLLRCTTEYVKQHLPRCATAWQASIPKYSISQSSPVQLPGRADKTFGYAFLV